MNKYTHTAKNSKKQYKEKEKTANVCVYMHTYMYVHTQVSFSK